MTGTIPGFQKIHISMFPTPRSKLIRWCQPYQSGAFLLCPYLTVHIGIGSAWYPAP